MQLPKKNLTNKRFGRLKVLQFVRLSESGHNFWLALCNCGVVKEYQQSHLIWETSKSCGCLRLELSKKRPTIHGQSRKHKGKAYGSWEAMKQRCLNTNAANYKNYGAVGIKVCKSWKVSFKKFLKDLGNRPSGKHTLDRINPYGNYEPGNCRWATAKVQSNNTRKKYASQTSV